MRGANTIIPARFLALVSHFCVVITLLWNSKRSARFCLPLSQENLFPIYYNRLVAGFATSIALIIVEFVTFISGLTMFSPSVSLISIGSHGAAPIVLTYFVTGGWFCDWFWLSFTICSVVPACADLSVAVSNLWNKNWCW